MSFIGFGFLLMLIRKSDRNSALPSYFMVMAISLQWATLCYGFFHIDNGKILLDLERQVTKYHLYQHFKL